MKQLLLYGKSFGLLLSLSLGGGYILQHRIHALSADLPPCTYFPVTPYSPPTLAYAAPQKAEWKAPKPQDQEGVWVYGLWHPPCFSYDGQGSVFQAYPLYSRQNKTRASAFHLLQLEQLYYPIVFEGYYQATPDADYTFVCYDTCKKQSFRFSLGDKSEQQLQCVAFHSRQWDSEKQCLQEPFLEVWDASFQKKFVLPLQEKLLLDSYSIAVVQSEKTCIQFRQVGDSGQLSEGLLSLKGVYPQYKTILLEYWDTQNSYPDYFYLSL